jgi:predicted ArsR family transcriptional regulator
MADKKKTMEERVIAYLRKRKTPATVFDVAGNTGISESSARSALLHLRKKGLAALVGRQESLGYTGRPANLYVAQ